MKALDYIQCGSDFHVNVIRSPIKHIDALIIKWTCLKYDLKLAFIYKMSKIRLFQNYQLRNARGSTFNFKNYQQIKFVALETDIHF